MPDSTATFEVYLPDDLDTPIYDEQVQLDQWGQLDGAYEIDFDLKPDMVVGIRDMLYNGKPRVITMTLSNLAVTDFDPETNVVQGIADSDAEVLFTIFDGTSWQRSGSTIVEDVNGAWSFIFAPTIEIQVLVTSIHDEYGNSTSFVVNGDDFLQTVDSSGDTLTATDDQGDEIVVEIPAGAVDEAVSLAYIPRESTENPDGFSFIGTGFELNAYQDGVLLEDYTFQTAISITLEYSDEDVVNIDESSLTLDYWDETAERWVDAATTCDPASAYQRFPNDNYIVVEICHLSSFVLVGENQFLSYVPFISR